MALQNFIAWCLNLMVIHLKHLPECLCDDCFNDYASGSSFKEYPLICHQLKCVLLRFAVEAVDSLEDEQDDDEISSSDIIKNFIELDSILTIAASLSSFGTVWFIKVKDTSCFGANHDDYGNVFAEGTSYLARHFLEKISETEMKQTFQLTSKTAYFHQQSILYPYRIKEVQFTESKKGLVRKSSLHGDITIYQTKHFFTLSTFYNKLYC